MSSQYVYLSVQKLATLASLGNFFNQLQLFLKKRHKRDIKRNLNLVIETKHANIIQRTPPNAFRIRSLTVTRNYDPLAIKSAIWAK